MFCHIFLTLEYHPQLEPEPDPSIQDPKVTPDQIKNVTQDQNVTPDPNQVQIVTLVPSGQFQPVTPDPIQAVTPVQVQPVIPDQIQPVTSDQAQPVTPVQIQLVTPEQIQPVTSNQIQPVTLNQFQLVVPELQGQFQPMTPATPVTPATPDTPAAPVTPVTLATPVTPVTPIQPVTFRCDQTITYRDLDYLTAVDVMENENYLEETFDFDEIRFFRRQGFQSTSIVNPKILSRNKRHATCDPTVGWNDDPGTFDFPQLDHVCFFLFS